jgi:glycosyltransferase involved in cell wall biosynthesis
MGIPVVTAFHEPVREIDRLGPLSRWIYRQMEGNSTVGVAYSAAGATALVASGLFEKATELPHGCSPVEVTSGDLARVREKYRITSPLIISLGFSHVDKGTDLLVEAMSEITRRLEGDVQFLIAGSPRPRRGVFRLLGRADRRFHDRLSLDSHELTGVSVAMCGFIPGEDVAALLHLASAVVLPYRRSTQSGVANQALAAGAVVLASDIPELRADLGTAAHFFRSGSVADLVDKSVYVLSSSQDAIREAAILRATERSYDVVAARLVRVGLAGPDVGA